MSNAKETRALRQYAADRNGLSDLCARASTVIRKLVGRCECTCDGFGLPSCRCGAMALIAEAEQLIASTPTKLQPGQLLLLVDDVSDQGHLRDIPNRDSLVAVKNGAACSIFPKSAVFAFGPVRP